ncbi:MAG: ParB/RepB/Spo0J family partition protein, partial [Eubacteriales bacterium]|nr:ParB/RepB/Spo0J family partition protein [Eubacteriales bacterium]
MKKGALGLGRGLDSLLPDVNAEQGEGVTMIAVEDIDVDPRQPRRDFDERALNSLADSIRSVGIIQPILVTESNGRFRIVAGERRFRAARLAGLAELPCLIRELDKKTRMEYTLIENLQREDLNPIEEAQGIRELMQACGYTQDECAKRIGKSRPVVANLLRLLTLPEEVAAEVRSGRLSEGHARTLVGVTPKEKQILLMRQCLVQGWTVRQLEQAAARGDEKRP